MKLEKITKQLLILLVVLVAGTYSLPVHAQGEPIRLGGIEDILWVIVATIQFYTLPILAIVVALLGFRLVTSGDDISSKENIKGWIFKVLIGGAIIFSAATIAQVIKTSVGG
jgi:hypothetical protein